MAEEKQKKSAKATQSSSDNSVEDVIREFSASSKAPKKEPSKAATSHSEDSAKKASAKAESSAAASKSKEKGEAKKDSSKAPSSDKAPKETVPSRDTVRASTATSTAGAKSGKKEHNTAPVPTRQDVRPRSAKPAHQIIPFVLIVVAVFVGVSLLLNVFCNRGNALESDPSSHWMGLVGYYLCYGLFGCFGPAVFVLPILMLNLAFFWKKYIDNRITISKIIASLLFLILFAALIHTFYLIPEKRDISAEHLLYYGVRMVSGGIIGGKLSFWLVNYLNIAGTIILSICLLIATLFYCLGMTPQVLLNHFRAQRAIRRAERSDARAARYAAEEEKAKASNSKEGEEKESERNNKSAPADKRAPMPMPTLDPSGGTRPFVPADVSRKLAEEAHNKKISRTQESKAVSSAPAITAAARSTAPQTTGTTTVTNASTPPTGAHTPINPAKNQDTAIDPIFPKTTDGRQIRKVPKADRNFDLKNVFINLDEGNAPQQRSHATLPPEVPLKSGQRRPAAGYDVVIPKAEKSSAAPTPAKATAERGRPAVQPKEDGIDTKKVVIGRIKSSESQDYGLTSEEFEKLEQQKGFLPPHKKNASAPSLKNIKPATEKSAKANSAEDKSSESSKLNKASNKKYVFPPISYLHPAEPMTPENEDETRACVATLKATLENFRVSTREIDCAYGPTVTRYEVVPAPGVRVRSFVNLADDISLALASGGIRIEAPIPGKSAVGIEVPNKIRSTVFLRHLIESKAFKESKSKLTAGLGADITGNPLIFDISKMPHLLVAGTTGSGKSVCINCIIMSLLYKAHPEEVKLVLIDPKKVEFSVYKNIPHLMAPIVTTPKDAAGALQAAVEEMERRFELFEQVGVPNLGAYNEITKDDPDMPFKPHIVIIIDELADLMMTASDEVETAICRIAQKARAAGIHLIVGTQRPSVDVVTGLIKSNIPSRIAFTVASQVDSKTILDYAGAEKLAGRGDMLFAPIGAMKPARVQGAFVDEKEVERICEFLRATNGTAQYDEVFTSKLKELAAQCGTKGKGGGGMDAIPNGDGASDSKGDQKYVDAVRVAVEEKRISTSLLQRKLEIGYSRAAKIIDRMQAEGLVSAPDGAKPRAVLITPEEFISKFIENADESTDSAEADTTDQ